MRIFCLLFLACFTASLAGFAVSARAQTPIPAGVVSPEDAAFGAAYAGRRIQPVTGKILNMPAEELKKLMVTYTLVTPFAQFQEQKTVRPGEDGRFVLSLDYPFPYQQIWLEVGELFYAGIYANDGLEVELDMNKIRAANGVQFNGNGVRYLGADGPLNEYLNNFVRWRRDEQQVLAGKIMTMMPTFRTAGDSAFPPAKADFLKLRLATSTDVDEQKIALEHTIGSMHTTWCVAVEKEQYQRAVEKIDEINQSLAPAGTGAGAPKTVFGEPLLQTSFGASMYVASPGKALDFLSKLKQSFPGKAIIIDRWATWCAPCLAEMPHSKELQEESKDLPVVFVYLCTVSGSSESKWKSKVAELKLPGIHFLIDAALDADLSRYFSFSGYPGYALIDSTGHYKPGAIQWMSSIADREALAALIK